MVLVIRKSSVSSRSSLPAGASSCQVTSRGRRLRRRLGRPAPRASVPSRCRRKYSLPLAEEPSRLARQTVSTRGKFSGASGSSQANRSRPAFSSSDDVRRRPARPAAAARRRRGRAGCGRRSGTTASSPSAPTAAIRSAVARPANAPPAVPAARVRRAERVVAELVGVQVPVRGLDHLPGRAAPVRGRGQRRVAGDRADLLLPDVVRPAAAVDALAAGQRGQRQERAVDRVGVEPVVRPGAHDDHRPAAGLLGVGGELPGDAGRGRRRRRR